jgi:hypothetical protein
MKKILRRHEAFQRRLPAGTDGLHLAERTDKQSKELYAG